MCQGYLAIHNVIRFFVFHSVSSRPPAEPLKESDCAPTIGGRPEHRTRGPALRVTGEGRQVPVACLPPRDVKQGRLPALLSRPQQLVESIPGMY